MPIRNFNEISTNKQLVPIEELARTNYILRNQKLLAGDFTELGIKPSEAEAIRVNMFRRVAEFYPEFMLSERPDIQIETNPGLARFLEGMSRFLWNEIGLVNVDLLATGYGVAVSHPTQPVTPIRINPRQHYELVDNRGAIEGDLWYMLRTVGEAVDGEIDIYEYPMDGTAKKRVHKWRSGQIGDLLQTVELPARAPVRQAIIYPQNSGIGAGPTRSLFEDMKDHVKELSNTLTRLAGSIKRNSRPHLYGPASSVNVDARGKAQINIEGEFFPLQPQDQVPGYLQWDPKIEAVEFDVDRQLDFIYLQAGVPKILFDPERLGNTSGRALRRLLLPFISKLNGLKETNALGVESLVELISLNNFASGGELFQFSTADIAINWKFEELFEDTIDGGNQDD